MQVPLEITYRGVDKSEAIDSLIREKADKLEQVCNHLISCRVSVEKTQQNPNSFRVRLDMRVPPNHEMVVVRENAQRDTHQDVYALIREGFEAGWRQLKDLVAQQRGNVKTHPTNESNGVVDKLFRDGGYGFLKSWDGRDIFFHEHSVLGGDFARLEVGTGVRYVEEAGEKGPQASTVQIMDKRPGSKVV